MSTAAIESVLKETRSFSPDDEFAAQAHISSLAQYREMAAFSQFASDLDAATQKLLARGARLTELLKQPQFSPLKMEEQVCVIYAGVNGYLDPLPVNRVRAYEDGLLALLRSKHVDLLNAIRDSKDLSSDNEAKLKALVEDFSKSFA